MLQLLDKTTYASITSTKWNYKTGCGSARWVYGDNTDVYATDIVYTTCHVAT
jgi:hypothetical protein